MAIYTVLEMLLAIAAGVFAAVVVLPSWLPGLSASLCGPEPKAYWYLSRSSAERHRQQRGVGARLVLGQRRQPGVSDGLSHTLCVHRSQSCASARGPRVAAAQRHSWYN